jgi:phosphoribosyl 1,2-cyclic phosphate phosphodiesterase
VNHADSHPPGPMRVTFLGTGTSTGVPVPTCDCHVCTSGDPRNRRLRPSVRVEWPGASVLVDTATDLREQALRYEIRRIDAVLYTHAHADHVLGLDELRLYNWRQRGPIPAYGSPKTIEALRKTFWYVFDDQPVESTKPAIETHTVDGPFTLLGRRIVPVPLYHGSMPILGFRIGRMAYLTDVSRIPDASYRMLEDLDVLVLNALRDRPHPTHLTIEQALAEAERIGARRTYLTHLSHEVEHAAHSARLPRGVDLSYDGLSLEVADDLVGRTQE